MGLDLAKTVEWMLRELADTTPLDQSMHRIIDQCAAARPHPDWRRLRALPFSETASSQQWIENVFLTEPPTTTLRGLWFGICNPVLDDGPGADLYISGSERHDPDPNNNAWAVGASWWPQNRYACSSVMRSIYRIAYRPGGLKNNAEYPLCLAFGALLVREVLCRANPELVVRSIGSVGVATGFDDGDFLGLGTLTKNGLVPA